MASCVVCLSDLKEGESVSLSCNHQFCVGCMKRCAHFKIEACPTCRRPHELDVGELQGRLRAYRKDYRNWRAGGVKGARGSCADGVANPITDPAPFRRPAAAPAAAAATQAGDLSVAAPKVIAPRRTSKTKKKVVEVVPPPRGTTMTAAAPLPKRRLAVLALCATSVGGARHLGAAPVGVRWPLRRKRPLASKALGVRGGLNYSALAKLAGPVAINGAITMYCDASRQMEQDAAVVHLQTKPPWMDLDDDPWATFSWKRLLIHGAYGLGFKGALNALWYDKGLPSIVGTNAPLSLCVDLLAYSPLVTYPLHYAVVALAEQKPVATAIRSYLFDFKSLFVSSLAFWLPAQFVLFALVPLQRRIEFNVLGRPKCRPSNTGGRKSRRGFHHGHGP